MHVEHAERVSVVHLDASEATGTDWVSRVATHDPVAVIVRGAMAPEVLAAAVAVADAHDGPHHDVSGMRVTGTPLCLTPSADGEIGYARYLEHAAELRERLDRAAGGPSIATLAAKVLGALHLGPPLPGAADLECGRTLLGAALVTMPPGHGLPFHFDRGLFNEGTLYPDRVGRQGYERVINYVVPIELPPAGGVIEMTSLRWSDLGPDPAAELDMRVDDVVPFATDLRVGDLMILDAMEYAHRVTDAVGTRRLTYTGSIGLGPRGAEMFV